MLDTELGTFRHVEREGLALVRATRAYSVPNDIASKIDLVANIIALPAVVGPQIVSSEASAAAAASAAWPEDCGITCLDKVTPQVLSQRYSLSAPPVGSSINSSLAVAEFQGQVWDQGDLDHYRKTCALKQNVTVDHEAGTVSPGGACKIPIIGTEACGESLLDIEMAKAIGGDTPLTDVYASSYSLLNWAKTIEVRRARSPRRCWIARARAVSPRAALPRALLPSPPFSAQTNSAPTTSTSNFL